MIAVPGMARVRPKDLHESGVRYRQTKRVGRGRAQMRQSKGLPGPGDSVEVVRATAMDDRPRSRVNRRRQILTTRVGLEFPTGLSFDAWAQAGRKIVQFIDSSAWYLGDWLVYGQDRYDDRYRLALHRAGLDYQTLRNYAWVVRRFDISRRR